MVSDMFLVLIKVRGMPERDIESLGVMGWGLDAARKFFRRLRRRPQSGCLVNVGFLRFLTHSRDLAAILPGNDS